MNLCILTSEIGSGGDSSDSCSCDQGPVLFQDFSRRIEVVYAGSLHYYSILNIKEISENKGESHSYKLVV